MKTRRADSPAKQLLLLALPVAPSTAEWYPVRHLLGRAMEWRSAAFPGVAIARTAHPTALRPYYILGLAIRRKFTSIAHAKAAVLLAVTTGSFDGEPTVRAPR